MIEATTTARLRAVASTYLDRPTVPGRLVVVTAEREEDSAELARGVQSMAGRLGIPTCCVGLDSGSMDIELGGDDTAPLLLYRHPIAREKDLARLRPPGRTSGVDLLLWSLPASARHSLRSLYLLGMWSWALAPRQLCALLPTVGEEGPELHQTRTRWKERLHDAGVPGEVQLLERGDGWGEATTARALSALLRSWAPTTRVAEVAAATRRAAVALLIFLSIMTGTAFARPLVVTVVGPAYSEGEQRGGSLLWTGRYHTLRIAPGAGTRLADDEGVRLTVDSEDLFAQLDGEPLSFEPADHRVAENLVLHAREFSLVMREGRIRVEGDVLRIEPETSGPMLPGRQGVMASAVILVVILLLFWRAGQMRRRLDEPRVSLRRRSER